MVLGIIVAYLLTVMLIGFYAAKMAKTPEDFLVGGFRIGVIPATGTYLATFFSALSMLGGVGLIYNQGISGSWFPMTWATGSALGPILAYRFRRVRIVSAPEFFRQRYGSKNLQAFAALMTIVGITFMLIVQFTAMGIVWTLATGRTLAEGVIIGALLATIYTVAGGFLAVAWTDVIQAAIFTASILIGAIMVLSEVGGVTALYDAAAAISTPPVIGAKPTAPGALLSLLGPYIPLAMFFNFLVQGPGTGSHPQYLIRVQAAKDMRTALNTYKYSWATLIFIYISLNIIGVGGRVLIPTMPQGMRADWIMPYLFTQYAHPVLTGLLFAGILAAAMSTIDSQVILVSACASIDIARNLWAGLSDKAIMWISRVTVFVVGFVVICFSLTDLPMIAIVAGYSLGIIGLTYFMPVLLGLYWKRANLAGAWAGILSGIATFIFWQARWGTRIAGIPPIGPGIVVGAVIMVLASLVTPPPQKELWDPYFRES